MISNYIKQIRKVNNSLLENDLDMQLSENIQQYERQLSEIVNSDDFSEELKEFKKVCYDVFFSKRKKRYLLDIETFDDDSINMSNYVAIHDHIKTFIEFGYKGKNSFINVLSKNDTSITTVYSNFGKSISALLKLIINRIKEINLPYRLLKTAVIRDPQLKDLLLTLNNLLLIFPVQMTFLLDMSSETYMYYFYLPNFDCLRLCTPVALPGFDPDQINFNFNFVKEILFNMNKYPPSIKADFINLINRCRYGFTELSDIKYQVNKNTSIFLTVLKSMANLYENKAIIIQKFMSKSKQICKFKSVVNEVIKKTKIVKNILRQYVKKVIHKVRMNIYIHTMFIRVIRFAAICKQKMIKKKDKIMSTAVLTIQKAYTKHLKNKDLKNVINSRIIAKQIFNKKLSQHNIISYEKTDNFFDSTKKENKWFGFKNNKCLMNLILSVGETLDILNITEVDFLTKNYFRVKKCLGDICLITNSKQYIRFCRTVSKTQRVYGESKESFMKCYCPTSTSKIDYFNELIKLSKICKNDLHLFLLNNADFNENTEINVVIQEFRTMKTYSLRHYKNKNLRKNKQKNVDY